MKFKMLVLALSLLLLTGCADQFGVTVITTGGGGDADAPGQEETGALEDGNAAGPETAPEPEPESPAEGGAFLESLSGTYMFCSGAGGWSTDLTLLPDGSFAGVYHDSDMGTGDPEKYPGGIMYICRFSGRFTQPEKLDETTWSLTIESLELDHPADGTEEFADGVCYIYSEPYGLDGTETITVYLPDTPVEGLTEDVLWVARGPYDWQATDEGTLGLTILYNEPQGCGFAEYPICREDAI